MRHEALPERVLVGLLLVATVAVACRGQGLPLNVSGGFISNAGQFPEGVAARWSSLGGSVDFSTQGIRMAVPAGKKEYVTLVTHFVGATTRSIQIDESNRTQHHYMRGNDRANWYTAISGRSLVYHEVHPGIDLRYDERGGRVKSIWRVRSGVSPDAIQWSYAGHDAVEVDADGRLRVRCGSIEVIEDAPIAWQEIDQVWIPVHVSFRLNSDHSVVSFEVGAYDPSLDLSIDPTLRWSTQLGGQGSDFIYDVTQRTLPCGKTHIYVCGQEHASQIIFPIQGNVVQPIYGGPVRDGFVAMIDPDYEESGEPYLVWCTRLGGGRGKIDGQAIMPTTTGTPHGTLTEYPPQTTPETTQKWGMDNIFAIIVNNAGEVIVGGATQSDDFPGTTSWPPLSTFSQNEDNATMHRMFLYPNFYPNPTNWLIWPFNGYRPNLPISAANPPIQSYHSAHNPPGAYVPGTPDQDFDAFITKLAPDGSSIVFSTYWGGAGGSDNVVSLAIYEDECDEIIYVVGDTIAPSFEYLTIASVGGLPGVNPARSAAPKDGFLLKLTGTGDFVTASYILGICGPTCYNLTTTDVEVDANDEYVFVTCHWSDALDSEDYTGSYDLTYARVGALYGFSTDLSQSFFEQATTAAAISQQLRTVYAGLEIGDNGHIYLARTIDGRNDLMAQGEGAMEVREFVFDSVNHTWTNSFVAKIGDGVVFDGTTDENFIYDMAMFGGRLVIVGSTLSMFLPTVNHLVDANTTGMTTAIDNWAAPPVFPYSGDAINIHGGLDYVFKDTFVWVVDVSTTPATTEMLTYFGGQTNEYARGVAINETSIFVGGMAADLGTLLYYKSTYDLIPTPMKNPLSHYVTRHRSVNANLPNNFFSGDVWEGGGTSAFIFCIDLCPASTLSE